MVTLKEADKMCYVKKKWRIKIKTQSQTRIPAQSLRQGMRNTKKSIHR